MELEKDLERILRRERPPAGFAARVMKRIDETERRGHHSSSATWIRAVAAAVLLTIVGGGFLVHHEIERRRGEHARAQVLLALRITGSKMHAAREQVRDLGNH